MFFRKKAGIMNNLKYYRQRAKMSQAQLSKRSGVARSTIEEIENFRVMRPREHTMERLSKALGRSLSEIFYPIVIYNVPVPGFNEPFREVKRRSAKNEKG